MVKKWYVITKAGPGTRLGIYDNWPEVAEKVLEVAGSIFQGYTTEEEARSVWERAQLRAAADNASTGTGRRRRGAAHASPPHANANVQETRNRTITHTGAPSVSYDGNGTGIRNSARTHTYPSPEPSVQGTHREATSTRNHQHRSRGRNISLSSESGSESAHPRVSVDTSTFNESKDRTRTCDPPNANTHSQTMLREVSARVEHSDPRIRNVTLRSSHLAYSRSDPVTSRVSVDSSDRAKIRTKAYPSRSVHTQISGDTSFVTARSERTTSWVAETSAILPSVPESTHVVGARARSKRARDGPLRARQTPTVAPSNGTRRSPLVSSPRATVDTSYAISISSSNSSTTSSPSHEAQRRSQSRSPKTATLPPSQLSERPAQSSPEIWADRGFASQSPQGSSYGTPSSSPATQVTQIEATNPSPSCRNASRMNSTSGRADVSSRSDAYAVNNSASPVAAKVEPLNSGPPPQVTGLSKAAASEPQSSSIRAGTLRRDAVSSSSQPLSSVKVITSKSAKSPASQIAGMSRAGSIHLPPAHTGISIPRNAVDYEQRSSVISESGSIYPGLICRCKDVCSSCHLPRQPPTPVSRSSVMDTIGFMEPHVANDVLDGQTDPRSPIRGGGTGIPTQGRSAVTSSRPSPLWSGVDQPSSLFGP